MANETTHAVRQILMNELGLTREDVRKETRAIVEETVRKEVKALWDNGAIERLIEVLIKKTYDVNNSRALSEAIHPAITRALTKVALEYVMAHVRFKGEVVLGRDMLAPLGDPTLVSGTYMDRSLRDFFQTAEEELLKIDREHIREGIPPDPKRVAFFEDAIRLAREMAMRDRESKHI